MVGEVAADGLYPVGLTEEFEVLPGQLPGRLDGLRAAGSKEHAVEVAWGKFGQFRRQLDGRRMAIGPNGEVTQLGCLVASRPGQFRASVA